MRIVAPYRPTDVSAVVSLVPVATAPLVRARAAVMATSVGVGLGKDGFAVIRVTMPLAYVMSVEALSGSLRATVV